MTKKTNLNADSSPRKRQTHARNVNQLSQGIKKAPAKIPAQSAKTLSTKQTPAKTTTKKSTWKKPVAIFAPILLVFVVIFGVLIYFSNAPKANPLDKLSFPQLSNQVASDEAEVRLVTSAGDIDIKLFPKQAPKAVENFLTLAKQGYYADNQFFRVVNDFMIQTGSKDNSASGESKSSFGQPFANEISEQLYNIRGAISMANDGTAQGNGSQFFIVQNKDDVTKNMNQTLKEAYPKKILDAYKKGGYPALDGKYTVFGQVVKGMSVVDKIATAKTTASATEKDSSGNPVNSVPVSPVVIQSVQVLKDWDFSS